MDIYTKNKALKAVKRSAKKHYRILLEEKSTKEEGRKLSELEADIENLNK